MEINRTADGSFGTVYVEYENPYLLVFVEDHWVYSSGDLLGLTEEPTARGWAPRSFFVANAGLLPTEFYVAWQQSSTLKIVPVFILLTLYSLLI